jgi:hypothetical protein
MTNPFAILGLPESLLLDPAAIESAWREHHRDDEGPAASDGSDQNRARALLTKESITAQLAVQEMLQQIQAAKACYLDRFAAFEEAAENEDFTAAAAALGPLKFLKKWEEQCRERLLALIAT